MCERGAVRQVVGLVEGIGIREVGSLGSVLAAVERDAEITEGGFGRVSLREGDVRGLGECRGGAEEGVGGAGDGEGEEGLGQAGEEESAI